MLTPRPLALAALLLGAAPTSASPPRPDTYVELIEVEVDSLDPAYAEAMNPLFNIYEPLVGFAGPGTGVDDLVPMLATTAPTRANGLISADGRTYRFPIRAGVRFHDGSLMTPEDVRYSLLRFMLMDAAVGSSAALLEPVTGLKSTRQDGVPLDEAYERAVRAIIVDRNAVVVRLQRPFAPFLSVLANFGRIVSKRWCAANGQWDGRAETWKAHNNPHRQDSLPNDKANGTGPFRLERWDPQNHQVVFARFDGYWRKPARLKRVFLRTVPSFLTRRLMLEAGDADSIWASPLNAAQLVGVPGVSVQPGLLKLQAPKLLQFAYETDPKMRPYTGSGQLDGEGIPPDFFADKDVRLGFAHAIDCDRIVRDIFRGQGERSGSLFPQGLLGHRADAPLRPFDLKQAERHFRKAWGGRVWQKGFWLAIPFRPSREEDQALFQMLKRNLEAINPRFRLESRLVQWAAAAEQMNKKQVPLYQGSWVNDYPDSHDIAFATLHSAGRYAPRFGIATPGMDLLIETAAAEQDPAKRDALYRKMDEKVVEELPFILLMTPTHNRVQRSWVKGYAHHPGTHGAPYMSYYYPLYKAD